MPPKVQWNAAATKQLHAAAAAGDGDACAAALAAGANPCALNPEDDSPPLMAASAAGHAGLVARLLSVPAVRAAQTCTRPSDGKTALHVATEAGHTQVVDVLLTAQPDLIMVPDLDGWLPLHWAAYLGNHAIAARLLQASAVTGETQDAQKQVQAETLGGDTPVSLALQMVGSQWSRQADTSATGTSGGNDFAPLFSLLHAHGARVNTWRAPRTGGTALHEVVRNGGSVDCIACLTGLGVPVDAVTGSPGSGGVTALHLAVAMALPDHVSALVEAGAGTEVQEHDQGATPLLLAAQSGAVECLQVLLSHQADAWAQDKRGFSAPTLLLLACDEERKALPLLTQVIDAAVSLGGRGSIKYVLSSYRAVLRQLQPTTALHVAARKGWAEATGLLLAAPLLVKPLLGGLTATDAQGHTPLATVVRLAPTARGPLLAGYVRLATLLHDEDEAAAGAAMTLNDVTADQLLDKASSVAPQLSPTDEQLLTQLSHVLCVSGDNN